MCILPLATLENIVVQKCLIPNEKFPVTARPGQWAKCYFHELDNTKQNYAVCQLFPRDDEDCLCYLDTSVCSGIFNDDKQLFLDDIKVLDEVSELSVVNVIFHINPVYCINNDKTLSKSFLNDLAQILLQKYHLTNSCVIRDTDLIDSGIDFVSVHIDSGGNGNFVITDETFVNVENVLLTKKPFVSDQIPLNVPIFQETRQNLEDFMGVARMQRYRTGQFRTSLNVLIVGPVGCGKSTLVEDFLQHHQCNVFRIAAGNVMKQYPGETEAELRKIFKAACQFEHKFKSRGIYFT